MVKLPEPAHPDVTPVRVQVPEITLLWSVPCSVSRLLLADVSDWMVIWKEPLEILEILGTDGTFLVLNPRQMQSDSSRSAR